MWINHQDPLKSMGFTSVNSDTVNRAIKNEWMWIEDIGSNMRPLQIRIVYRFKNKDFRILEFSSFGISLLGLAGTVLLVFFLYLSQPLNMFQTLLKVHQCKTSIRLLKYTKAVKMIPLNHFETPKPRYFKAQGPNLINQSKQPILSKVHDTTRS